LWLFKAQATGDPSTEEETGEAGEAREVRGGLLLQATFAIRINQEGLKLNNKLPPEVLQRFLVFCFVCLFGFVFLFCCFFFVGQRQI
jgi:hypothetical protein